MKTTWSGTDRNSRFLESLRGGSRNQFFLAVRIEKKRRRRREEEEKKRRR
jgi:hypothetical protein